MTISLIEPEVVLFVDQVFMLKSSAPSPKGLKVSSHMPERPLLRKPGDGFEKCEIDGKCALGRRLRKGFCDLAM
jgi:hypothetical protein